MTELQSEQKELWQSFCVAIGAMVEVLCKYRETWPTFTMAVMLHLIVSTSGSRHTYCVHNKNLGRLTMFTKGAMQDLLYSQRGPDLSGGQTQK